MDLFLSPVGLDVDASPKCNAKHVLSFTTWDDSAVSLHSYRCSNCDHVSLASKAFSLQRSDLSGLEKISKLLQTPMLAMTRITHFEISPCSFGWQPKHSLEVWIDLFQSLPEIVELVLRDMDGSNVVCEEIHQALGLVNLNRTLARGKTRPAPNLSHLHVHFTRDNSGVNGPPLFDAFRLEWVISIVEHRRGIEKVEIDVPKKVLFQLKREDRWKTCVKKLEKIMAQPERVVIIAGKNGTIFAD
ncbi:unnamed protein product [Somion occarium]|uniref:Uncharacterized protein n=1 Tax=Somion occarium TaxID=3059160 RepID=A0ABP1E6N4_9APHY